MYEPLKTFNLGYAIRRAGGTWTAILADVTVPVDPMNPRSYRAGDDRNIAAIEKALSDGDEEAEVTIKIANRREVLTRRVQRAISDKEDWLSLWSDLLDVEVLEVHSYEVFRQRRDRRR